MSKSCISIIVPTYQHAKTLPACLDSLLAQTYKEIEIIVIDDGSTDNTQEVLKRYANKVISQKQKNAGANAARNRGFQQASGDYIIFCDADVVMEPMMIELLYGALQKNIQASFAYCAFRFGWKQFKGIEFDKDLLKSMNYIHTTALIRAKDFPGFDLNIKRLQDWDLWLTMVGQGKSGVLVNKQLFSVQISGESRIGSSWLPSIFYQLPWHLIGWQPSPIKKYQEAKEIIDQKHNICRK